MDRLDLARESGGGESTRLTVAAAGALALAVIHQYLFMDRPFGLSVPLFFALFLMFLFWVAGRENRSGTPFAWAVLGGIVLLSMTYVWFSNPVFQVLNIPALALLVSFYALLHTGQGGKAWYGREMAFRLLYHLVPKTIAAWLVINHVGVDRQVAALNIARHEAGGELDAAYFRRLSHDAVPVLIEASRKYPDIRSGLENRLESLRREDRPLLSFNWSSHRAIRLLEAEFR